MSPATAGKAMSFIKENLRNIGRLMDVWSVSAVSLLGEED
jgi:hypothetical protein